MKNHAIFFLIFAVLMAALLIYEVRGTQVEPTLKTVLVLSPFQLDLSTNTIAGETLRAEFRRAADLRLDVYYEHLDLTRFPDSVDQQQIFDLLVDKYKDKPVDLILVGSKSMQKLWLDRRVEILADTPVVFFDVITDHLVGLRLPADAVIVSGVEYCEKTVRWMLGAMPAVKEIVLAEGVGKIEQGFFDHIKKLQENLNDQVTFTDLLVLPPAEIKQRASQLSKAAVVLYHPMFEEAKGNRYYPLDVVSDLTAAAAVPVISDYDQMIGTGILGGYMYSIDQHARDSAQIGLRILRGEAVNRIPIAQNTSNRFIFGHQVLQRFAIPIARLPLKRIIRNRQYSFWELYQPQIIASGFGIVVLLFLVFFLLGMTRKLDRTRLALAQLNANLETQVQDRTALLNLTNTQLQEEITERTRMEAALRESEGLTKAVLNSLNAHIAVIDSTGMIISVNEPWRDFARANGVRDLVSTVERVNYFDVLRQAELGNPQEVTPIRRGMEEVLNGVRPSFQMEYACDNPTEKRWFKMVVVPLASSSGGGVITHEDITLRKMDERAFQESKSSLQAVLQSTADGILAVDPKNRVLFANEAFKDMWKIPAEVLESKNDAVLLEHVLEQLLNPQVFLEKVQGLYQSDKESFDVLYFKDGRVFERLSRPLMLHEKNSGRVWSFLDITEQKQAEEQLRQSEERFRSLLDSQESTIMMLDYDGVHHYVNQEGMISMGASGTAKDILGKRLHDLYPADIADWQLDQIRRVFNSREGISGDFEIADGNPSNWWHLNIQPIRSAEGQVVQVMVNSINITERKRAEQALRESEARTATIFRMSPIVIGVSTAAEGRYTDVNDAFEDMLGYSKSEVIGRTSNELNLWADEYPRVKILQEIQAFGRVVNLEVHLRRKSGEVFPALMFITPIVLHNESCLLAMVMDITERKQAEEQLRETRDALQTIIHSAPLAILALDPEDHVTIWNPSAEEMFGWSEKQILGEINPTVPENKIREYDALRQATLNGMAFSNLDTVRQKKNGEKFPVSLSVAPLRGQQMQVIGRMHILADITERKKLQEELRHQATTDELTRVANRRHFLELADREIKRAIRLTRPLSVALMDIDHFKKINDTYGHAAGDHALIGFAKLCQKYIREIDVFARFGGDEFVLLLPETNLEQAYEVMERVRLTLMNQPFDLNGRSAALTISSGLSCFSADLETIDTLIRQADEALYRAKEDGRNRVVRYDRLSE